MSLSQLPSHTIKLLSSTQVITSVMSVVKELMENAIDAGATNIEVMLENNGLNRIEIKDNGCGIVRTNVEFVCLPHYTSKIIDFCDLSKLISYGFRGEALSSLCNVAEVTITTRTADDEVAMTYTFNKDGVIINSKPSHFGKGTYVAVSNLFRNLPVRKQFLSSRQRSGAELKRVKSVVKCLAVIHPGLRVVFCHNKCMVWQKPFAPSLYQSVLLGLGHGIASRLEELSITQEQTTITLLVPKRHCKDVTIVFQSCAECMMIFFNLRPVQDRKLEKLLVKLTSRHFGGQIAGHKYPVCLVSVKVSPELLDVNLEPNKTQVLCKVEDEILQIVEKRLLTYYELSDIETPAQHLNAPKRPRLDGDLEEKTVSSGAIEETVVVEPAQCHKKVTYSKMSQDSSRTANSRTNSGTMKNALSSTLNGTSSAIPGALPRELGLISGGGQLGFTTEGVVLETLSNGINLGTSPNINTTESVPSETCLASTKALLTHHEAQAKERHLFQFLGEDNSVSLNTDNIDKLCQEKCVDLNDSLLGIEDIIMMDMTNRDLHRVEDKINVGSTVLNFHNKACVDDTLLEMRTDVFANEKVLITGENIKDHSSVLETKMCGKDLPLDEGTHSTGNALVLNSRENNCSSDKCAPAVSQSLWDVVDKSMELWSRGSVKAPNGDVIQGSKMLLPKVDLNLSTESVTSQMGCKEQSAFTKFSREIRPKIFLEHPGLAFTKVASMLVSRWQALSDDERCRYETLAKEERKKPWKSSPGNRNVRDMFISHDTSKSQQRASNCVEMSVTPEDIRSRRCRAENQKRCELAQSVVLIGQLKSPGVWLYQQDCQVGVVRHWALYEMVVYRKFMAQQNVPVVPLDTALPIHEGTLGPNLWNMLQSLNTSVDPITNTANICSPVITKNGFVIQITVEQLMLTHVASTIRFYGLDDLREVLQLCQGHTVELDLTSFRPLKVVNYFKSEAVRLVRQAAYSMDRPELMDLIHMHNVHDKNCLHGKLVFQVIHSFNEQH